MEKIVCRHHIRISIKAYFRECSDARSLKGIPFSGREFKCCKCGKPVIVYRNGSSVSSQLWDLLPPLLGAITSFVLGTSFIDYYRATYEYRSMFVEFFLPFILFFISPPLFYYIASYCNIRFGWPGAYKIMEKQ